MQINPVESARKISVTGPDGAGKDTAWRTALEHIDLSELTVLKIGKPSSIFRGGEERHVDVELSRVLDWAHEWADYKRSRLMTSVSNTAYVMFQWRIQEKLWSYRIRPDIIFSLRDGYVDPAAYAPYYMPDTLGRLSIPNRINFLHGLHGSPRRDHTIFLDIDPVIAVERIANRIEAQNEQIRKTDSSRPIRPKWQHQHENVQDLTAIREEFFSVLKHLENSGTQIGTVDASYEIPTVGQDLASKLSQAFTP